MAAPTLPTGALSLPLTPRASRSPLSMRDRNIYDTRFHLTPVAHGKTLPRAWERKPATPFAPRTESHKIWKRYGLRSQNSDEGSDIMFLSGGRVGLGKENLHTVRAIKRLRNDFDGATATKLEGEPETRRRKRRRRKSLADSPPSAKMSTISPRMDPAEAETPNNATLEELPETDVDAVSATDVTSIPSKQSHRVTVNSENEPDMDNQALDASRERSDETIESHGAHDTTEAAECRKAHTTGESHTEQHSAQDVEGGLSTLPEVTPAEIIRGDEGSQENDSPNVSAVESENKAQTPNEASLGPRVGSPTKEMERVTAPVIFTAHLKAPIVEDTELLMDFLFRAQAKKAARMASSPARRRSYDKEQQDLISPVTRSRSALVTKDGNSTSPRKGEVFLGPPAGTTKADNEGDDTTVESKASSPLRRSRRTPLPKPQKIVPTVPSTIPLRRADGTEFIFLQRTEAQELALATRSNTKRNKGEATMPKYFLQTLAAQCEEIQPSSPVRGKRKSLKQVSWDEQLAYFEAQAQHIEQAEQAEQAANGEEQPPAKRARRARPVNGTPAPKKAMRAAATELGVGMPMQKGRGKARVR